MSDLGAIHDIGDAEPDNVIAVESTTWIDYGWGEGYSYSDYAAETAQHDSSTALLAFGRTTNNMGWKYYIGGKSYAGWETVLRRFGPVRVTMLEPDA